MRIEHKLVTRACAIVCSGWVVYDCTHHQNLRQKVFGVTGTTRLGTHCECHRLFLLDVGSHGYAYYGQLFHRAYTRSPSFSVLGLCAQVSPWVVLWCVHEQVALRPVLEHFEYCLLDFPLRSEPQYMSICCGCKRLWTYIWISCTCDYISVYVQAA